MKIKVYRSTYEAVEISKTMAAFRLMTGKPVVWQEADSAYPRWFGNIRGMSWNPGFKFGFDQSDKYYALTDEVETELVTPTRLAGVFRHCGVNPLAVMYGIKQLAKAHPPFHDKERMEKLYPATANSEAGIISYLEEVMICIDIITELGMYRPSLVRTYKITLAQYGVLRDRSQFSSDNEWLFYLDYAR